MPKFEQTSHPKPRQTPKVRRPLYLVEKEPKDQSWINLTNMAFWQFVVLIGLLVVLGILVFFGLVRPVGATYFFTHWSECAHGHQFRYCQYKGPGTACNPRHAFEVRDCQQVTPTPTLVPPTPTQTPEATPTVIPTPPTPNQGSSVVGTYTQPVCTDGMTLLLPANLHVVRNGSSATVKWFQTQGNQVNIYYKENGQATWTHAVGDVVIKDFNEYVIRDLNPGLGYTFGLQQKQGCGGGETVIAVVVDPPAFNKTFGFSFWRWSQ